jgi:NAD(P)-dependent dehydrogenase (short-subunit alcohol dehydrogenase family)
MQRQQYGRIILIGSTAVLRGMKGLGAYSATKAGVVALGRVLAIELAEFGVTVNSVCPSTVPAGTGRGLAARHGIDFEELKASFLEYQAIQTLLEPADISNAILFLVSDEARYVTGVTLPVDGGTSAL